MAQTPTHEQPTPQLFMDAMFSFMKTATIKGAIDLQLFTAVHALGVSATVATVAQKIKAPERSTRIILDYLSGEGLLTKANAVYTCTPSTAMFLVTTSPAYMGAAAEFLASDMIISGFKDVASLVRSGTTLLPAGGTTKPDHEIWVKFAHGMTGLSIGTAQLMHAVCPEIMPDTNVPLKVLDVAAGHGIYGISIAQRNPNAHITFLDWAAVLEVAKQNAAKFGVADRCDTIAGSAFDVDLNGPYDIILLTNILHHFNREENIRFIKRMVAALKKGTGRLVTLEVVPNEERTAPRLGTLFPMMMLASTPSGDAYTMKEFEEMFVAAGMARSKPFPLPSGWTVIVSYAA